MSHTVRATALAACLTAAACGGSSATGPRPAPSSPLLSALTITAEPAASVVSRDGGIDVTVRVVNRADTVVTVVGSGSCGVRLEVRDAGGRLAGQSRSEVCTDDCRAYVFAPGQAVTRVTRFFARYWDVDAQRERSLPAGRYDLAGRVDGTIGTCGGARAEAAGAVTAVRVR